ncbi:MAG: T9SS type A sorting domain-containing protein [Ginsengibacter sp.]
MKLKLLLSFFLFSCLVTAKGQDTRAFAITGQTAKNFNWTDIRVIDLQTGNVSQTLFENGKTKFNFQDAVSRQIVRNFIQPVGNVQANTIQSGEISPTMLMSAATAYDKRHEKLFFASMRTNRLVWLDTKQMNGISSFYTIDQPLIDNPDINNEALNITRMAIGADGNGYALTNDGTHLIRFLTGKKIIISDLGSLQDAPGNNGISIHNQCSSWGGDMVADAFGKLYLFTATKNVFVIDPNTRVASYKGAIVNLTPTFTLNGAAVIDDNNVLISSANTFEGFYKINIDDLTSKKVVTDGQIFNASDLASCNLLKETDKKNTLGTPALANLEAIGNKFISVYPNPVSNSQFKITFDHNPAGKYMIELNDLQGRLIERRVSYIKSIGQVENFRLQRKQAAGIYMIKITDGNNKIVFSDKLIVQ